MTKQPLTISEEAKVQMPMKTVASLIAMVAIGTWAFFSIQEKLNKHATKLQIMEKDLLLKGPVQQQIKLAMHYFILFISSH